MGISSGTTSFVLGREEDGNREVITFEHDQDYGDLPITAIVAYTSPLTQFPYTDF